MKLRHNRLLLLFLAGSMTLSSVVPVSASTIEKAPIESKMSESDSGDQDDSIENEDEDGVVTFDGDEADYEINEFDDEDDSEAEEDSNEEDDSEAGDDSDDEEGAEDKDKNRKKSKEKDDREAEEKDKKDDSEPKEVSENEAPSEDVSNNEVPSEEVSSNEAEKEETENIDVSENAVASETENLSIFGVSENIAAHSVSICAISGMENKPSKLADGTLGLVRGMKWYVGKDAGAESGDKNLKANAKKGFFQVRKVGTAMAGVNGKSYNVTIVDPVMSEKKIDLNVGGQAAVKVNNKADSTDLEKMGYTVAWVSSNPNVAQVVSGNIVATGLGTAQICAYIGGKPCKMRVRVKDTAASTYLMDIPTGKSKPIKVPKANKITWTFEGNKINIKEFSNKVRAIEQGMTDVSGNDSHGVRVYNNDPDIDTSYGIDQVGKNSKRASKYTVKMCAGDKLFINLDKSHELPVWKSKDPSVAQVSEYGVIIAEGKGTTVLSTKHAGRKIQLTVVVGDERSYDYASMSQKYYKKILVDDINGNGPIYAFIRLNGDVVIGNENPDDYAFVHYDANGGTPSRTERISKGRTINSYEPTKKDSDFLGWLNGSYLYDFNSAVNDDLGLTADWKDEGVDKFLLMLDPNGGKLTGLSDAAALGMRYITEGTVDLSDAVPVRDGYTFAGWFYQNGNEYKEADVITNNTVLIAHWTNNSTGEIVDQANAYVLFNDGHGYISVVPTNTNKTVNAPDASRWEGHIFNHWEYSDGKVYTKTDTFHRTTILTAKWDITDTNESVVVKFKPNNGEADHIVNVKYGEVVDEPEIPVKGTAGFLGWYAGDELYDFDTPVTRAITLTAYYSDEAHTVSFDTGVSGCTIPAQHIVSGNKARRPHDKYVFGINPNHTFAGWHNAAVDDVFNFNVNVESDLDLHALWADAEAHLLSGKKFNEKVVEVSGGAAEDIENFAFYEDGIPDKSILTEAHIVSDSTSNTPIYIWKDGNTLFWWSEDTDPYLSEDCESMFEGLVHLTNISGLKNFRTDKVRNFKNIFNNTAVTNVNIVAIGWGDLLRLWELDYTDGDYRTLSFNFVDKNAKGKNNDKSYVAYTIRVKNPSGGTSLKTGYIRNGDTLKVLKGTEVRLTAPQFKEYQYNHYFDNWSASGKAFDDESGQKNLSEFTGSSFIFEMSGDAVVNLETVPMPGFFG